MDFIYFVLSVLQGLLKGVFILVEGLLVISESIYYFVLRLYAFVFAAFHHICPFFYHTFYTPASKEKGTGLYCF